MQVALALGKGDCCTGTASDAQDCIFGVSHAICKLLLSDSMNVLSNSRIVILLPLLVPSSLKFVSRPQYALAMLS